jgi:hypothetical protein
VSSGEEAGGIIWQQNDATQRQHDKTNMTRQDQHATEEDALDIKVTTSWHLKLYLLIWSVAAIERGILAVFTSHITVMEWFFGYNNMYTSYW